MYPSDKLHEECGVFGIYRRSGKGVIDAAAARAERQLLRMRVKARKGTVRKQRAASAKN